MILNISILKNFNVNIFNLNLKLDIIAFRLLVLKSTCLKMRRIENENQNVALK